MAQEGVPASDQIYEAGSHLRGPARVPGSVRSPRASCCRPASRCGRSSATIGLAEQAIAVGCMIAILTLVLLQVLQRYLPDGGWAWTGEVARLAMVWLAFILSGYLLALDRHITIQLVDYVLPPRAARAC